MVYLQGFGVCDRDGKQSVTPDTLFPIASCTKAFTATAMAVLVDEARWRGTTGPQTRRVLPPGRPVGRSNVTLARPALPTARPRRHDWPWDVRRGTGKTLVRKIGHLKPTHSFPLGVPIPKPNVRGGGYAVGRAAKTSWEAVVRQRLFEPLGMTTAIAAPATWESLPASRGRTSSERRHG